MRQQPCNPVKFYKHARLDPKNLHILAGSFNPFKRYMTALKFYPMNRWGVGYWKH